MWILFTVIVLVLIWAMGGFRGDRRTRGLDERDTLAGAQLTTAEEMPTATPLEILQYRYASGEISQAEYDQIRRELTL